MTDNRNLFNGLIGSNNYVNIPITDIERIVLKTAIEREIKHRLENHISFDTSEDIICLRNILENLYSIPEYNG